MGSMGCLAQGNAKAPETGARVTVESPLIADVAG